MNTDLITFRDKHVCHYVDMTVSVQRWDLPGEKTMVGAITSEIDLFNWWYLNQVKYFHTVICIYWILKQQALLLNIYMHFYYKDKNKYEKCEILSDIVISKGLYTYKDYGKIHKEKGGHIWQI